MAAKNVFVDLKFDTYLYNSYRQKILVMTNILVSFSNSHAVCYSFPGQFYQQRVLQKYFSVKIEMFCIICRCREFFQCSREY